MTIPSVIYETKNFYLADIINEQIEILKAAGLVNYWHMKRFDKRSVAMTVNNYPTVIRFHQLAGSFQVLIFGLLLSLLALMVEFLNKKLK